MSTLPELSDIDDVEVIELAGKLLSSARPRDLELSFGVEVSVNEESSEPTVAFVKLNATLSGTDAEGEDNAGEQTDAVYEAISTVLIGVNKPLDDDKGAWFDRILQLAWPYLRGATIEHAQRLNAPKLKLPVDFALDLASEGSD